MAKKKKKLGGCRTSVLGNSIGSIMVQKKHIVAKDVVGLLLGEIVSTKKTHIVAKDVVGLLIGDIKNDSLTKMKTY